MALPREKQDLGGVGLGKQDKRRRRIKKMQQIPEEPHVRKIAIGRMVGLFIAVMGIFMSIRYALLAVQWNTDFHQALTARPMETTIDLSQTGETTVPFHQTYSISHSEVLCLQCDLNDEKQRQPEKLFKGLSGKLTVRDFDDNEIKHASISSQTVQYSNGEIIITEFLPFRKGGYLATIRIDAATPALAAKKQTIYAKYFLCGAEKAAELGAGAFSLIAGLIGIVASVFVLPGLLRRGIWRQTTSITHNSLLSQDQKGPGHE